MRARFVEPHGRPPQAQEPGPSDQGVVPGKGVKGKSAEQPNETTGKAAKESAKPEGKPAEQTEKPANKAGKPEEGYRARRLVLA